MRKTAIATAVLGVATLAGCGTATSASHPTSSAPGVTGDAAIAAGIVTADGYRVVWSEPAAGYQLSEFMQHAGDKSLATGVRGSDAEQVVVFSGHNTCQVPQNCTAAYNASVIPQLDPGAHASASGLVLRITGPVATLRKDGIPGL